MKLSEVPSLLAEGLTQRSTDKLMLKNRVIRLTHTHNKKLIKMKNNWKFVGDKITTDNGVNSHIIVNLDNLKDLSSIVVYDIINIHNENKDAEMIGSSGLIDDYLLNSTIVTQEQREEITEQIYIFYETL